MSAQQSDSSGRGADFDALADLFLGDESEDHVAVTPTLRLTNSTDEAELTTEVLMLGHLPVRANPWVAQYAKLLAEREDRPVALVRMGAGQMGIDLYGLDPGFRECQAESDIDGALSRLAKLSTHLLFQVTDIDELALARAHASDRVTILTAANDAAVVSVYRTIKALSEDLDEIGIAVMGEPEERAHEALSKLREATRTFLTVSLAERGVIDRMGPTGGAMVYLGDCGLTHNQIIERIEQLRSLASDTLEPEENGDHLSPPLSRSEWEELDPESFMPQDIPLAPAAIEPKDTAVVHEESRVGRQQDTPAPMEPPVADTDFSTMALSILELKPIGAACPDDEGVVLARDERGAMHLVVEDRARRGIERLTAVSTWACKHAKLLGAIDRSLAEDGGVVMHLLTERPKDVRHLLDCDVRVHAIARADGRIGTGFCFLELN